MVRAWHAGMAAIGAIIVAGVIAGLTGMEDPTAARPGEGAVRGDDTTAQADGGGSLDHMTVATLHAQNEAERYEDAAGAIYRISQALELQARSSQPSDPDAVQRAVESMHGLAAAAEKYADTLRASEHDGRIAEAESLGIQAAKDDIASIDAAANAAYLGLQSDDHRPAADALAQAQYRLSTVDGPPLGMIRSEAALAESKAKLDRAAERLAAAEAMLRPP